MSMIEENFKVIFKIEKIGSIKSWPSTTVDGVTYPPSIKVRVTNIESKEDAQVGVREIETIVDFQIPTETLPQLLQIQERLRKLKADNKGFELVGNLPRKQGSDEVLKVKSNEPLSQFLKRNNITIADKK